MQKTDRFMTKLRSFAHTKPQLPLFSQTHLPTFQQGTLTYQPDTKYDYPNRD